MPGHLFEPPVWPWRGTLTARSAVVQHGGCLPLSRRRYVARGVPGGYRIWDNTRRRWWGDHSQLCPDELLAELNGDADHTRITTLIQRYRGMKR